MTISDQIFVKSHVARDVLQNGAIFKTDKLVVWEYVANSLQYVEPGRVPTVKVTIDNKKKRIVVADNGRGMDWPGLANFFVMHGENADRKEGHPGRGRFGTGKSAAFGIADVLRITTVKAGLKSQVELRREDLLAIGSTDAIPVRTREKEVISDEPNGTVVEIENVHLKTLDHAGVSQYIERHLARWPKGATVYVNNHECEFIEPPVSKEFAIKPYEELRQKLGETQLVLKVSKVPLEEDLRGVSIYSNSVWHETTLAGSEGREMAQYIFGEIDVPALDDEADPIAAFDLTRSMRLNPNSEIVKALYQFIGQHVERIRRDLVEADKQRRATEDARKLARQADDIARLINDDFESFRQRLAKVKAAGGIGSDLHHFRKQGDQEDDDLLAGTQIPGRNDCSGGWPRKRAWKRVYWWR